MKDSDRKQPFSNLDNKKLEFLYQSFEPKNLEKISAQYRTLGIEDAIAPLESPLLKQFKRERRKRTGVKAKEDVEQETKAFKMFFENMRQYNYPYYLLLTGNYAEYQKYFKKTFYKGRTKMIGRIKKRFKAGEKAGHLKRIPLTNVFSSEDEEWQKRAAMFDARRQYLYYEYFILQLTKEHYEKQCALIEQSFHQRTRSLQLLLNDAEQIADEIHVELVKKLNHVAIKYNAKHNDIKKEKSLEKKYFYFRLLEKNYSKEYQSILVVYAPHNKQAALALEKDIKMSMELEKKLNKNDAEFANKIKELRKHQTTILKQFDNNLDKLLQYMETEGLKYVPKEHQEAFLAHLSELHVYREKLTMTQDVDALNNIFDEAKKVFVAIEDIVDVGIKEEAVLDGVEMEDIIIEKDDVESGLIKESLDNETDKGKVENSYASSHQTFFGGRSNHVVKPSQDIRVLDEDQKDEYSELVKQVFYYIYSNFLSEDDFIEEEIKLVAYQLQKQIKAIEKGIDSNHIDSTYARNVYDNLKKLSEMQDDNEVINFLERMSIIFEFESNVEQNIKR